jgi:NADPH:quinone reductase-like Zn-dependent oxidoreductase
LAAIPDGIGYVEAAAVPYAVVLLLQMAVTSMLGKKKAIFGVAFGTANDFEAVANLMRDGVLRPVVSCTFSLDRVADAHTHLETVHPAGEVVVTIGSPDGYRIAAK